MPSRPVAGSITRPPRSRMSKCWSIGASPFAASPNRQHTDNPRWGHRQVARASVRLCNIRAEGSNPWRRPAAASATACRARRTIATCAAAASSSPTSAWPACGTLPSCAARVAHARIRGIHMPAGAAEARLHRRRPGDVRPIAVDFRACPASSSPTSRCSPHDKVRHVGEPIAVCVAATRAEAEDLAAAVAIDFDELPAVVDMLAARRPARRWCTSTGATTSSWKPCVEDDLSRSSAPARRSRCARTLRTARQCMSPLEGRGVVAVWDRRLEQLLVYTSTQMPHIMRTGLADCLGLDEGRVRVVAPDVGGGFGYKGILLAEEVVRRLARAPPRPPGALDRGSARATHRQRQLPRAPLRHHRLRRRRRPPAGAGCRGDGRCRRLFRLSVLRLPGSRAGRLASCPAPT